jgi:parallel beta-helix repeat protein
MQQRISTVAALGAALFFVWTLRPAAADVPVVDDLVITGNVVLRPGTYTVDDVHADGVIQIAADNITLDGTGVVIQGVGFHGNAIRMNGHKGLTLRNFTILGYDYGIRIDNASNVLIETSNVSGNRKDIAPDFLHIECGGCYGGGILFRNVSSSRVRANTLTNQSTGLEMIGGAANTVYDNMTSEGPEGNELRQNSCWGIRLDGSTGNLVRGNVADYVDRRRYGTDSNDSAGILLTGGAHDNRIISNSFTHSGDGFFLGNTCALASLRNYVYGNDGSFSPHNSFEATFSSGNVFERNWANGSSEHGFWLGYSYDSRITRNEISRNHVGGISIDKGHGNEIDRNSMRQNSLAIELWAADTSCPPWPMCPASCPSADYRIHHNNVTLNSVGLSVENTAGAAVSRNQLVDNGTRNVRASGQSTAVALAHNNLSCLNSLASAANLAYLKVATANNGLATAPKAVDGTVFVNGSAWVPDQQLQPGQWWQVDLGAVKSVSGIVIYPYYINLNDFPYLFHVDVSSTGAFAGEQVRVATETARPLHTPLIYEFPTVQGRYVRLVSDEQRSWVQMMEFAVFASPGQIPAPCQIAVADEMPVGFDVNAVRAFWGTTDPAAISALIFDHADDPSRGTVTFQPPLPEAIPADSGTYDPGIGAWSTTTPLPQQSAAPFLDRGQQLVFYQGMVYLFGGSEPGNPQGTRVFWARLLPDGRVGPWTVTTALPGAFYDHVAVRSGSRVYLITGAAGATQVYQASLLPGGGVGAWTSTSPLSPSRQSFAAVAYGGRLYASGGNAGGPRDFVKMATVQTDGSLTAWQDTAPLPETVQSHAMAASDGFLYVIAPNGHVWKSALQSDGTAGAWQAVTSLPAPVISPAAFANDGSLYVLEGSSAQVLYAAINTDGTLGAWQATTAAPEALRALRAGAANGFVYTVGGWDTNTYRATVRVAPLGSAIGCQGGETVTAPFTNGFSGVTTTLTYQGLATLSVSGVGQASGSTFSDAFYLFAQGDGTPIAPSHPQEWALALNGQKIDNFLVDGIPPYRPDHRYTFRVRVPAGALTFGVSDGFGGDNTGRYIIGLCGGTP